MFDSKKIDSYFSGEKNLRKEDNSYLGRRAKIMRWVKLLLPSLAALLTGLLIVIPSLQNNIDDLAQDITRPRKGELEKLHMENTVFYITDADNKVNNFTADNIDETEQADQSRGDYPRRGSNLGQHSGTARLF